MHNKDHLYNLNEQSFLIVSNDTVVKASQFFANLTEYSMNELLNKNITDLFKFLRIGSNFEIENIDVKSDYFLFTRTLEVKFIYIEVIKEIDKQIYIFKEKVKSIFEDESSYLSQILSDNLSGIAVYSVPDFTLLKANQTYLNFYEAPYTRQENALGMPIYDIITGFKDSSIENLLKDTIANGKTKVLKEFMYDKYKRGVTYWDSTITPLFEGGRVKYIVCNVCNVTERVVHRKDILKQKDELEAVIENINDAIFIYDTEGNLYTLNKAARDYFPSENLKKYGDGYAYTKFFSFDNTEIPPEERPFPLIKKGHIVNDYKAKMVQGDTIRYINISGRPVYNLDQSVRLSIVRSRDITEDIRKECIIKEQQELLLKKEREKSEALKASLEMKDEFLSIISHEFRTPLNVINSAIQAINYICKDELSDRAKDYVKMIKQNVLRQMRLVNNLLDITRANSGNIKINKKNIDIVHLTKSITESVNIYASEKGVSVTFVSSITKKVVGIDDEKYERILLNLISNAIKFSVEEKSITVKMRSVRGSICIEVSDIGIGIPEEKIDLIFERFGQVDSSISRYAEGAGIGLSLVKRFVEALGGSISLKSKLGKGSTFTILLPCEKFVEKNTDKPMIDLLGNRLIEITNVEFSDIYF